MSQLTYFSIPSYTGHYSDTNMCNANLLTEISFTQYSCSRVSLESECADVDLVIHNGVANVMNSINATNMPTFTKGCFYHYENNQMVWNGHTGVDQCNEENGIGFCVCHCVAITPAPTPFPTTQPTALSTEAPTTNSTRSPTTATTIGAAGTTVNPYWVEEEDHTQSYAFIGVGIVLLLAGLCLAFGNGE